MPKSEGRHLYEDVIVRVFVVGTGRCGTVTFYRACRHIIGFTCDHEGKAGSVPPWYFNDNHIEIGSHLYPQMSQLVKRYPDARWVHLYRNKKDCVRSIVTQCRTEMEHYSQMWFHAFRASPEKIAAAYYDSVNATIPVVVPECLPIPIEHATELWEVFLDYIGGPECSPDAVKELELQYNATGHRGIDNHLAKES